MSVPPAAIERARELLYGAARPLVIHDNDPDGVVSFCLVHRICGDARSVAFKNKPAIDGSFLARVEEHAPDLVVILDTSRVTEEFLGALRTPVLWIDHHEPPQDLLARFPGVHYVNPRVWDDTDNRPTSYWMYQIAQANIWLATVGCVADWYMPDFLPAFRQRYADLLPEDVVTIERAYLETKVGTLVRVIQFNLKGTTSDVRKSVMTLARIDSPYEILLESTAGGRLLWRRYQRLIAGYDALLKDALAARPDGIVHLFAYAGGEQTYTAELSNELLIRFPDRIILIARSHDGKRKCSIRSRGIELPPIIAESLRGCEGHGGGHANACGTVVREEDWERFYARFRELAAGGPLRA